MSHPRRMRDLATWRARRAAGGLAALLTLALLPAVPATPAAASPSMESPRRSVPAGRLADVGCSVPLDRCAPSVTAPANYYGHVDYSWIPVPADILESHQLAESLRLPPLLQVACQPISDEERRRGGETPLTHAVAKASLLRLVGRPDGLVAVRLAFTGAPGVRDVDGSYRRCLDRMAPGWAGPDGGPDTGPGWREVVADIEAVPALTGRPGTSDVPLCRGEGDWDVTMALVVRVWGLMDGVTDAGLGRPRAEVADIFAKRAWLQGGPADVDVTVCNNLPNPFPPHLPPVLDVPETENHTWLIRTTRFLHNELLPIVQVSQFPRGDEVDNYVVDLNPDNQANGLTAALSSFMDGVRDHDWIEYNSRPYSRYQMIGLLNLHDFARDPGVRAKAADLLHRMSIKQVAESADHLRIAPFRRRLSAQNGNLFQGRTIGPMYQVWLGGLAEPRFVPPGDGGAAGEMALAASSGFRPADWLADLVLSRERRDYLSFFGGQGQGESAYGGPDFTITGGGVRTACPYGAGGGIGVPECLGSGNDPGSVEPIVVIPRRRPAPGDPVAAGNPEATTYPNLSSLIRIDPVGHQSTCLHRDFACGNAVTVPADLATGAGCRIATDHGYGSSAPNGPVHHFGDLAVRIDQSCAGPRYAGRCFFVYTGTLTYDDNAYIGIPRLAYLVTHTCSPTASSGETDAAFRAFVAYMQGTGKPGGDAGRCPNGTPDALCVYLTVKVPPKQVNLTGVTTGNEVAAYFHGGRGDYYIQEPSQPTGVIAGDLTVGGGNNPVTTTALSSSATRAFYGQALTFTARVRSAQSTAGAGGTVTFQDGTRVLGIVGVSGGDATLVTSALGVGTHRITATYSGDSRFVPSRGVFEQTILKAPTRITYTGDRTGDYHDPARVSATLVSTVTNAPLPGQDLTFRLNDAETCTAPTGTAGTASCTITPQEPAADYPLTTRFAGDDNYEPSSTTVTFTVTREQTATVYTGATHIANGTPARMRAVLAEDGVVPIAGRTVTFALGPPTARQTCAAVTDPDGVATCAIGPVDQPLNDTATVPVTASFDGDPYYLPSGDAATLRLQYATGRAAGITADVRLPLLTLRHGPAPDTGPVRTAHATTTNTPCTAAVTTLVLTARGQCVNVTTTLNPGTAQSTATITEATIGVPGLPVIGLSGVRATSVTTCAAATGTVAVTVTVAGVPVAIPAGPNGTIELAGGARLVVNEQLPVAGADRGLTVNAVHLTALGGAVDVVVGSVTTGAHNCAPPENPS